MFTRLSMGVCFITPFIGVGDRCELFSHFFTIITNDEGVVKVVFNF